MLQQYASTIAMTIFGSACVPLVLSLFWSSVIWYQNKKQGFPTYEPGHLYAGLVWDSGYTFPACKVHKTTFRKVIFITQDRVAEGQAYTRTVKKAHLCTGKVAPLEYV